MTFTYHVLETYSKSSFVRVRDKVIFIFKKIIFLNDGYIEFKKFFVTTLQEFILEKKISFILK